MKTVLVFYERISKSHSRGLGFASYNLAKGLLEAGLLDHVICLALDPDVDLPREKTLALMDKPLQRMAFRFLARLGRILPGINVRRLQETLFDRFVCRNLKFEPGKLLFCSRPLFLESVRKARASGMETWVQSSVPHPLYNYALVRNEEIRLGLESKGAYSDISRALRMAKTISAADKLVTIDPEIGRFTYDSYLNFLGPDRLIPLKEYFSIDPEEFAEVAAAKHADPAGPEVTFLHLSHINLIKGIPYLLDAWKRLQQSGVSNCRLLLAGKIDYNVRQLIDQRYGDLTGVEFLGFVPDLKPVLASADVFISSSIADAGPATIIEAMSAGLPVVSSRNCGFASLVSEKEDGFTYQFNDVAGLTDILAWFASNPGQVRIMGSRARNKMENLSTGRYAQEVLDHIRGSSGAPSHNPHS